MGLIATHNSGTGERSRSWYHALMTPIARCQTLTIAEQYEQGCNYFDLRVRDDGYGKYYLCHGLWESRTTLSDALLTLTQVSFEGDKPIVTIFYEGRFYDSDHEQYFLADMQGFINEFKGIDIVILGVKKPEWKALREFKYVPMVSKFAKIVGWKCLLPFPFLWWAVTPHPIFNNEEYQMVDFL